MATVPTFPSFDAGETLTADKLNQLAIASAFYGSPPRAKVRRSGSNTNTASETTTYMVFTDVDYDTDNMVDLTAQSTRITVVTPGWYQVYGSVSFNESSTNTGNIRSCSLWQNTGFFATMTIPEVAEDPDSDPTFTNGLTVQASGEAYFNAGDYIRVALGRDVAFITTLRPDLAIFLSARWIGV